jgi:hypothetical protein
VCLLITLAAAIAATLAWRLRGRGGGSRLDTLALMYWGAALMWTVDGFFNLAEGEPFFDLSPGDAQLGLLVAAAGLLAWLALRRWRLAARLGD